MLLLLLLLLAMNGGGCRFGVPRPGRGTEMMMSSWPLQELGADPFAGSSGFKGTPVPADGVVVQAVVSVSAQSTALAARGADGQAALEALLHDAAALLAAEVAEGGADADGFPSLVEPSAQALLSPVEESSGTG